MNEHTDRTGDGSTDDATAKHAGGEWRDAVTDAREVEIDWREARSHLDDASAGSDEATRLRAEMQRLREEYVRLIEEARSYGRELGAPGAVGAHRDPNQRDA
ncbi:MAG: hypothetical protein M3P42_04270 [Actinomycetota bacterium]|nr:hypothetical protein [Actinomycetota bacterium]